MNIEELWSDKHDQYIVEAGDVIEDFSGSKFEVTRVIPCIGTDTPIKQRYLLKNFEGSFELSIKDTWVNLIRST